MTRVGWVLVGVLVVLVGLWGLVSWDRYFGACAGSAGEVEYRAGMTLCPGQSVRVTVPLR